MPHLEQQGPPDSRPTPVRETTPRVGITESLIAPGVTALPVVARRSSSEDLFTALGLAGAAAGVLGEQARFLIHQQRGVAIRQAKEELPGLLQSIQEREILVPDGVDPGVHSRAIVDERIDGSGMSKAAAQAYRDVLVPGLATGFVREQQNIKNEQTSMALLSYKDAVSQATTSKEIQAILTEMRTELTDVPDVIFMGILTEAGTAAANNGDMTRVDAIRAVLGDTNIDQQQKMIRTLDAVNRQRKRTNKEDLDNRMADLREQRRLGTPLSAIDKFMELWVDNPEVRDFDEDKRSIQWSNFLLFDARISADAGDIDGVKEAMRHARLPSTQEALIPMMLAARTRADAVARREGEEILSQMFVQQREGTTTFDEIEKEMNALAEAFKDRLLSPSTWLDRQLTRLEQRRAGEDTRLLGEALDQEREGHVNNAVNNALDAFKDDQDFTTAVNLPDLVYPDLTGRQITIPREDIAEQAYKAYLDELEESIPDPEDEVGAREAQAEKFKLRLQFLATSGHIDRDFVALLQAGARENFTNITPEQVTPLALRSYQLYKELDLIKIASVHTNTNDEAFFREAKYSEFALGRSEGRAMIESAQPDLVFSASPTGRPTISDDLIDDALEASVVGKGVTRDIIARQVLVNMATFLMRKNGTAAEFALKEGTTRLDGDYTPVNGFTVRTRGINIPKADIQIIADVLIDFYVQSSANAGTYTKEMLAIRHVETTGQIFVTRFNTGEPVEGGPIVSIREFGTISEKHREAANRATAKIGSHKRVQARVDEQFRRIQFRENAFRHGWADRNDSLETIKQKGRPRTLMMPRGMWNVAFTNVTDRPTISESFDPTMPEGTRTIVVDIVNFIGQNQSAAIRRATTVRVRPPVPGPGPVQPSFPGLRSQ